MIFTSIKLCLLIILMFRFIIKRNSFPSTFFRLGRRFMAEFYILTPGKIPWNWFHTKIRINETRLNNFKMSFFIKHRNLIPMVGVQHIQVGSLKALKIAYTRDNIPRGMKFSWDLIFRGFLIDPRKLNRVKTNSRLKNKSAKIVTRSKVWNPNCAKICSSENYKKQPTCAKLYFCENFMPQGSHFIAEDTMESCAKLTF